MSKVQALRATSVASDPRNHNEAHADRTEWAILFDVSNVKSSWVLSKWG